PEAEIALGGDEILIFFPAESNVSEESAVSKVVAAISSHGLSSRIAHSHGTGGRETFASLDHSTSVHKAAEETFSKTVAFKGLFLIEPRAVITYGKVPDSFDPSNPAFVQAVGTLAKAGKGTTLFPISFGGFGTLSLEKGHLEIRFP
ncbi:MAG: hypothetical protein QG650_726, partial [Patescibacteria group bacterium]|nr:hypothetical protein [Patescibacteria group bacterium]